ncbi:MAG: ABC transporter permease [Anaerolineales bacterium]|nr:ABC transporter permease [Anaerolineales bacterium]
MDRLRTIMKKEFLHILRDPRTLFMIIVLPAMLLVLLGYGVTGELQDIPLAVADLSKTDQSRRFVDYFTASRTFEQTYDALDEEELLYLIDRGYVDAAVFIPEGFGRDLATGETAHVQFYINGSDPAVAQTAQLKLDAIAQMAIQDVFTEQLQRAVGGTELSLPIVTHMKTLYNPDSKEDRYMIPGLVAIVLQVQALLLTAMAIVREREQGTMEQLIVTPIKSWELMLGKILPYLLVGLVNTIATLAVATLMFDIPIVGNIWLLIVLTMIFILGSLGMGVLISNISTTQMQAMYLAVGIVIIPAIILSGLIFSREGMPLATYVISELLPVTHYLSIVRGVMLKGVGFDFLWPSIRMLIILSVAYFVASVLAFRKRI